MVSGLRRDFHRLAAHKRRDIAVFYLDVVALKRICNFFFAGGNGEFSAYFDGVGIRRNAGDIRYRQRAVVYLRRGDGERRLVVSGLCGDLHRLAAHKRRNNAVLYLDVVAVKRISDFLRAGGNRKMRRNGNRRALLQRDIVDGEFTVIYKRGDGKRRLVVFGLCGDFHRLAAHKRRDGIVFNIDVVAVKRIGDFFRFVGVGELIYYV